ncbi:MAG: PKD domain-containing protein [Bacteroidota bacterium]
MKRKTLFFTFLLSFISTCAFSQGCPPNIDFEAGDFSNWDCDTGRVRLVNNKNVITLSRSVPISDRHQIISSTTAKDPYGLFPQLCPFGGSKSVKLGNNLSNNQAEGLSYTFTVPATTDTFTFTYFYAVVFQNPEHSEPEQPRFFVTAYEVATGNVVSCASFDYVSTGSLPGFQMAPYNSTVLFRDWTPASLQFAGLGGKQVRLEFKTADCTRGGHFGYAYLDVGAGCSNILSTAPYCVETNSLLLNAPYGFQSYTWYNSDFTAVMGHGQSVTLRPPPATTGRYHVDAIPYPGYGCRDTFQAMVTPMPVPDSPQAVPEYKFCQFQAVSSPLAAFPLPDKHLLWYTTPTGGTASTSAPVPKTNVPGTFRYYVSQKGLFGCESFRSMITVVVVPVPLVAFGVNALKQCEPGNQFVFTDTTPNRYKPGYAWDFGDGQTIASETDSVVSHVFALAGVYTVNLRITNDSACTAEKSVVITVIPKPVAAFTPPTVICQNQSSVQLSDGSFVPGNLSAVNGWWWSIDGNQSSQQNPAPFMPASAGPLTVKLVSSTTEGCRSDTVTRVITVQAQPKAAYTSSSPLCDNEIIRFTDQSVVASGTGTIVKWNWLFNSLADSRQHPRLILAPGLYHGQLVVETNFGCQSAMTDSIFTIHSKPNIQLDISDSCATKLISYRASDLSNTGTSWYWNFGAGFYSAGAQLTKVYQREGYNPVTLVGKTPNGCKDTLSRPFTIYANYAFAGRDTVVARDEPLQLNANGVPLQKYLWTPATGLSTDTIEAPVATFDQDQLYHLYSITKEGCDNNSKILVKRFKGPELYIPTGFTPNGDGKNDLLKVFPVGIKSFHHFTIYNRLGQVVFHTKDYTKGWDGRFGGLPVDTGAFVVTAEALDYRGKLLTAKQTVMVIR